MYLSELCTFNKVKDNLLRTILLIVINSSNCNSGLTPHITIAEAKQSVDMFDNMKRQILSPDSDLTNAPFLMAQTPWSTIKHHKQQINFFHTIDIHVKNNDQAIKEQEIKKEMNTRAAHSIINLVKSVMESNTNTNTVRDTAMFNTPMYFGTVNLTVIATQIGATAHIPCVIHHIGDCVVSWIRKKDHHLLTVGLTTYSSDERFSATHLKYSEDWTLNIKFVQQRDAGIYECQVSTHPPTSIFIHLLVVEARTEISGPPTRYLTPGSMLKLHCHVVQNTESSEYIFWYHDNRMINFDGDRGINVSTESGFQSSELIISRTRREHSGNYTCVASNAQPASVLIHIFKGDNPAAMYHGHIGAATKSYQTQLPHILIIIISVIYRKL